jgi:hypothetical protein
MLLVVTGAGATYDSAPSWPASGVSRIETPSDRPPLANQLFEGRFEFVKVMKRFPKLLPIVPYLQSRGDRSLEQVLEQLQSETAAYEERSRQLAAVRYYLQVILGDCVPRWREFNSNISNYTTLLDQIERWRKPDEMVCFATFNYDLFLELDLASVGIVIHDLPDYIANPRYKLVKLHGSVNWGHQIMSGAPPLMNSDSWGMANAVIDSAPSLEMAGEFQVVGQRPMGLIGENWFFPAIAIPVETKTTFECPREHLGALEEFIPRVTRILSIGWRGAESTFLQMLSKGLTSPVEVLVVAESVDSAWETIERMEAAGVSGNYASYTEGFTSFIVSRAGDQLLSGAI